MIRSSAAEVRNVHLPLLADPENALSLNATGPATPVLVQTEPATKHRLVIGSVEGGGFVLDDETAGQRLGVLDHLEAFAVTVGTRQCIVVAGHDALATNVRVAFNDGEPESCEVQAGIWMSKLRDFSAGARVTVHWDHGDGHLRFTTIGPLTEADLIPHRESWTPYAPNGSSTQPRPDVP